MIAIAPRTVHDVRPLVTHVHRFATLDELAPYADDWDRLAAGVPFRGWTWLSSWWRSFGPQTDAEARRTRLAVLGVFGDAGRLLGIAPWYIDRSAIHGRVLRPLGSGEVCSEYLSVLCDPAVEQAVLMALAGYVFDNARDRHADGLRWDLLELGAVDAEDQTIADLVRYLTPSAAACIAGRE